MYMIENYDDNEEIFDGGDFVFTQRTGEDGKIEIVGGGYKINSTSLRNGTPIMTTYNGDEYTGGKVSSPFENLAVPAGLFYINTRVFKKDTEKQNNHHYKSHETISDDMIDKLYSLVEVEEEVEEDIIKKSEPINLEELIEKSVQDLAKNNDSFHSKSIDTKKQSEPIDLEVSFDEHLEKDKYINNSTNTSTSNKLFELEEANIVLDVEDLETTEEIKEDPNILKEVDLSSTLDNSLETIQLKKPNQVYYEIYKKAREKAKDAKKNAILAYLEMKNIKKTYMLDDIDESDSEFEEFNGEDSSSEISDTESLEDKF